MLAQAGAVNEQGSCARGEGSVKAAALAAKVISSGRDQSGLKKGSGRDGDAETLVTAAEEAKQLNERRR